MSQEVMNRYYLESGLLAEKLINTRDTTLTEPEYLRKPADLARYLESWNIRLSQEPNESDLAEVLDVRRRLRSVFEAQDVVTAVGVLNKLLDGIQVKAHIAMLPDENIQLELQVGEDLPIARRLAVDAALGLSAAIEQYGIERLHICSATPCTEVFIDTSRNQTRRYCSEQCANRHHVAAYRQRQKSD
jgi:predicted RNA-binding Zn ribbon-like protein